MEINTVNNTLFAIPTYLFCGIIGFVVAISVYMILLYRLKLFSKQYLLLSIVAVVSMFIFAKGFGAISGIYRAIGLHKQITLGVIKETGIVFYGGLCGFLLAYYWGLKALKDDPRIINVVTVVIPLFHAFGRIGCFLSGCCYGIEWHGFLKVFYTINSEHGIETVGRIPVQLIEASFNILLFAYLVTQIMKHGWKHSHTLVQYLSIYSLARFFFEFIRGDVDRGIIKGISFSQSISIIIWVCILIILFRRRVYKKLI